MKDLLSTAFCAFAVEAIPISQERKLSPSESQVIKMDEKALCKAALAAMTFAYAPYSRYTVGAALLTADGRVFTGCNIENAAFTPTVCAERTALFKAVSEGVRDFAMLAVAGGKEGAVTGVFPPCGVCRQTLSEFCPPTMPVLLVTGDGSFEKTTLGDLLPLAFSLRGDDDAHV